MNGRSGPEQAEAGRLEVGERRGGRRRAPEGPEHLEAIERRLSGEIRQVLLSVQALQNQVSSMETDIKGLKSDVLELQKEELAS